MRVDAGRRAALASLKARKAVKSESVLVAAPLSLLSGYPPEERSR